MSMEVFANQVVVVFLFNLMFVFFTSILWLATKILKSTWKMWKNDETEQ